MRKSSESAHPGDWSAFNAVGLSVALAKQHGLLDGRHNHRVMLKFGSLDIALRTNVHTSQIDLCVVNASPQLRFSVGYTSVQLKHGRRHYFLYEPPIDPNRCGLGDNDPRFKRCVEVVMGSHGLVPRAVAAKTARAVRETLRQSVWRVRARQRDRLLGLDGSGPARDPVRAELVKQLRAAPEIELHWPDLGAAFDLFDRAQMRTKARAATPGKAGSRSTLAGVSGQTLVERSRANRHAQRRDELAGAAAAGVNGPAQLPPHDDRPLASLFDCPSLNVDFIARRVMDAASPLALGLRWILPDGSALSMTVTGRFDETPFVHLLNYEVPEPERINQRIEVAQRSAGRWAFRCPVTGKLAQLLYLRDGIFASAKAQHLTYPSQRGPNWSAGRSAG